MKYALTFLYLLLAASLYSQSQCSDDLTTPDLPPWEYTDWTHPWTFDVNLDSVVIQANAYVKRRCGAQVDSLRKPFIFVEGVDFNSAFGPLKCGDFGWEEFSSGNAPGYGMLYNLPGLLDTLRMSGYDIILLDFRDGADYVECNSALLQELIRKVNAHKMGKEPLVVAGASMGGQITRHALRSMELRNENHCTRLWISLDSPHNGANIPIGLQETLWFLAHPLLESAETAQNKLLSTLLRPAARQFLKVQMPWASSLHETYQTMMDSLGYPEDLRSIGLANGCMQGTPVNLPPGEPLFTYVVNDPITNATLARLVPHALPGNAEGEIFQGEVPYQFEPLFPPFPCPKIPIAAVEDEVPAPNLPWNLDRVSGGMRPSILEMVQEINADLEDGDCDPDLITNYHINHSFIPTASALGLPDSLLDSPVQQVLQSSPELLPFDYVHGPVGANEMHSEISDLTMEIILHQIFFGENDLGPVLDLSSQNGGLFNFRDSAKHIIYDLTVGAGGLLRVNADLPAQFGQSTTAFPGTTPSGSHFNLRSNPCGADVEILEYGQIRLGDSSVGNTASWYIGEGSSLTMQEGSRLTLEAGSSITFGRGSMFEMNGGIVEAMAGASIIFEEQSGLAYNGGIIRMTGSEGRFEMGGKLNIGPEATFTIQQLGASTCPVVWTPTAGAVLGESSSVFRLKAVDEEDLVLHLKAEAVLKFSPEFHVVQIKRGRVTLSAQSSVHVACPFEATGIHVQDDGEQSYGFHTEDQTLVQNSSFDNVRFESWLVDGMLKIWDCSFTGDEAEVVVRNRGFDIRDSEFHCKGLTSEDLSFLSRVSNCTFTNAGIYADYECIVDQSASEIIVQGCHFSHSDVAVFKEGGELVLRCNTFDTNDLAIHAGPGTLLNMSADASAGFNDFVQNGQAIFFDGAVQPIISNGYNRFHQEFHSELFYGSLIEESCNGSCDFTLDCGKNTWSEDFESGAFGLGGPFPDEGKMDLWILDASALCLPNTDYSAGCQATIADPSPVDATACLNEAPKQILGRSAEENNGDTTLESPQEGETIQSGSLVETRVDVFTSAGVLVHSSSRLDEYALRERLSPGIYILRLQKQESVWTRKLVVAF